MPMQTISLLADGEKLSEPKPSVCRITVLPGDPADVVLEGADWEEVSKIEEALFSS